jgi:hypothetical protein
MGECACCGVKSLLLGLVEIHTNHFIQWHIIGYEVVGYHCN